MIQIGDEIHELPVKHPVTGVTIAADPLPSLECPRCVLKIEEPLFRVLIRANCSELQLAGDCRRCNETISGRIRFYAGYSLYQSSYGWRRVERKPARSAFRKWFDRLVDNLKSKI